MSDILQLDTVLDAKGGVGAFFAKGHRCNISEPVKLQKRVTNNICEIEAAIRAIEIAKEQKIRNLQVRTIELVW